jgi:hypothetical protein
MTFCKRTLIRATLLLSLLSSGQLIYSQYGQFEAWRYWHFALGPQPDIHYQIDTAHYYTYTSDGIYTDKKEYTEIYRKYKLLQTNPDIFRVTDYRQDGTVVFRHNAIGGSPNKWIGEARRYNKNGILIFETNFKKDSTYGYYEAGPRIYYDDNGQKSAETVTYYSRTDEYAYTTTTRIRKLLNAWDTSGLQTVSNGEGYITTMAKETWKDIDIIHHGKVWSGHFDSIVTGTYPDGRLFFRDHFIKGLFQKGVSYDSAGNAYPYKDIEDNNAYKANSMKCGYAIMDNVPYQVHENGEGTDLDITRMALRAAATCILRVETNSQNEVTKAYLIKGVRKEVDEHIMHAVHFIRNLQKVKYRGQSIGAVYYVSLVFPY